MVGSVSGIRVGLPVDGTVRADAIDGTLQPCQQVGGLVLVAVVSFCG